MIFLFIVLFGCSIESSPIPVDRSQDLIGTWDDPTGLEIRCEKEMILFIVHNPGIKTYMGYGDWSLIQTEEKMILNLYFDSYPALLIKDTLYLWEWCDPKDTTKCDWVLVKE